MAHECVHAVGIRDVTPSALGCEECLKIGSPWAHLRLCWTCGHVGCCDSSPNRHATKHFRMTRDPIIEGYDPPEGWEWRYVDEKGESGVLCIGKAADFDSAMRRFESSRPSQAV
jgi:Zn-finger in ubiquitin-hydrolases and other protein